LIRFIDDNNIKNVIFLTGDRHHSEISKLVTDKGTIIYDVTSSAITSTTYDHSKEPNNFRVEGSMISERNFAIFNITGTRKERKLSVVFKNTSGKEVYRYSFN
jgi:alkaline phosphatase D